MLIITIVERSITPLGQWQCLVFWIFFHVLVNSSDFRSFMNRHFFLTLIQGWMHKLLMVSTIYVMKNHTLHRVQLRTRYTFMIFLLILSNTLEEYCFPYPFDNFNIFMVYHNVNYFCDVIPFFIGNWKLLEGNDTGLRN